MIDHHYVEHTFVLLTAWLGLRWFQQPDDVRRAATLGIALGAATAFHNGLFILQLFPLLTGFILWLRQSGPLARALRGFGIALVTDDTARVAAVRAVSSRYVRVRPALLVPLSTWPCARRSRWLSWHGVPASRNAFGGLVALCAALALPLVRSSRAAPVSCPANFSILDEITEARSPYRMFTETMGPTATAAYYSWLLLLAPVCSRFTPIARSGSGGRSACTSPSSSPSASRCCSIKCGSTTSVTSVWLRGTLLLLDELRAPRLAPRPDLRRDVRRSRSRVSACAARTAPRSLCTVRRPRVRQCFCACSRSSTGCAPKNPAPCSRARTMATRYCSIAIAASSRTTSSCAPKTRRTSTRSTDSCG